MAELGSTNDPKALIPGDPPAVQDAAETLRRKAGTMQAVGNNLGDVRIEGWSGEACNAFWEKFSGEKPNWMLGHDAMDSAAAKLAAHGESLSWAQGQAGEAINLWERGRAATMRAAAEFEAGGGTFTLGTNPATAANSTGGLSGPGFTDPGTALRQQAVEILDRARSQLNESGQANATVINQHGGRGPGAPPWLAGPADFVRHAGPHAPRAGQWKERTFLQAAEENRGRSDRLAKYRRMSSGVPRPDGREAKVSLAHWQAEANLFRADAKGAVQLGDVTVATAAETKVGAGVTAHGGVGREGVHGEVRASAGAGGSAQVGAHYGPVEAGARARAHVGAEAGAKGSIGKQGLHAQAGGFAGAGGGVDGHIGAGGVNVGGGAEFRAGIGAEAEFHAGMEDGKFKIGGELGLTFGIGGKVGGEIVIDPEAIAETAGDAADALGNAASAAGEFAGDVVSTLNPLD